MHCTSGSIYHTQALIEVLSHHDLATNSNGSQLVEVWVSTPFIQRFHVGWDVSIGWDADDIVFSKQLIPYLLIQVNSVFHMCAQDGGVVCGQFYYV
jgi:hypothetical protein